MPVVSGLSPDDSFDCKGGRVGAAIRFEVRIRWIGRSEAQGAHTVYFRRCQTLVEVEETPQANPK